MTQIDLFMDSSDKNSIDCDDESPKSIEPTSDDWYTPPPIIEAARATMGSIDLDPASCIEANQVVRATQFFSLEEDGLLQPWAGNMWLNPPFSRDKIGKFVGKFISEYTSGNVARAFVLTNSATDTGWYHALMQRCQVVCLCRGRLKFWGPHMQEYGPRNPQTIFYFSNISRDEIQVLTRLGEQFAPFGMCYAPMFRQPSRV